METIKIKYLADIDPIESIEQGDWIDLRCAKNMVLIQGNYYQIPLGVAMQLPEGYEALVAPRSSLFKRHGLIMANSIGIIDNSYCGENDEWNCLVYATEDGVLEKNERICQFRIIKNQPKVELIKVESLGNKDRDGIGSTGK